MKTRITKRYLLLLFMFSAICGITKAQNSIDFTENFGIMTYQVLGVNKNGLRSESFSGKYRIYNHVGLLLLGYHLSVQPNPNRVYIYKGKTYSISDIPEINDIKITGVKGTLYIKHNALKPTEQERKIIINIGGYLDNSGSLGGNNIEVASKTPSTFPKNTSVRFVPEELYYNASAVQTAIEKRIPEKANEISALLIVGVSGGAILPPVLGVVTDIFKTQISAIVLIAAIWCYLLWLISIVRKTSK